MVYKPAKAKAILRQFVPWHKGTLFLDAKCTKGKPENLSVRTLQVRGDQGDCEGSGRSQGSSYGNRLGETRSGLQVWAGLPGAKA